MATSWGRTRASKHDFVVALVVVARARAGAPMAAPVATFRFGRAARFAAERPVTLLPDGAVPASPARATPGEQGEFLQVSRQAPIDRVE